MLIDDPGTFGTIASLAMQYGPELFSTLKSIWNTLRGTNSKHTQPNVANNPLGYQIPTIAEFAPVSVSNVSYTTYAKERYYSDTINLEYILSVLRPEDFAVRRPTAPALKTALSTSSYIQQITTNSSGSAAIFIWPGNAAYAGNVSTNAFALYLNDSTFNPTLGTYTNATPIAGPLYTQYTNILNYQ